MSVFAIRDGTLEKVDMVNSMCTTLAALDFDKLNKKTIAAGLVGLLLNSTQKKPAAGAGSSGGERTEFTDLTGTARIAKGIARNDDLAMSSPIVRVRGAGTVDLPRDQLDYRAEAELVQSCAGIGKRDLAGQLIPVTIYRPDHRSQGATADPRRPDQRAAQTQARTAGRTAANGRDGADRVDGQGPADDRAVAQTVSGARAGSGPDRTGAAAGPGPGAATERQGATQGIAQRSTQGPVEIAQIAPGGVIGRSSRRLHLAPLPAGSQSELSSAR